MQSKASNPTVMHAISMILLSCLPLILLVFGMFADLPASEPVFSLLAWWQVVLLVVCTLLPLLVLPRVGVHWNRWPR